MSDPSEGDLLLLRTYLAEEHRDNWSEISSAGWIDNWTLEIEGVCALGRIMITEHVCYEHFLEWAGEERVNQWHLE